MQVDHVDTIFIVDSHLSLAMGGDIKTHNKYNTTFFRVLSDHMSQNRLHNCHQNKLQAYDRTDSSLM